MHTRQLGNSDLHITPLGLGTWALGGSGWAHAWGPQDDQESIATIKRALGLGINWIDTAAIYGLGHSEEIVGKAIKGREQPYVFTKCSLVWDEQGNVTNNLKAHSLRREVEASLKRLSIDVIDLYQIHWPNPDADIEEGWSTLAQLKQEGKIRALGASNFTVEQLRRALRIAPVDALQPPYSLVRPEVEREILPFCRENNIGVIAYSPMASGLLTGAMTKERIQNLPEDDWRKSAFQFREPRLTRNLELANLLTDIGYPYNRTTGEVAIAWVLRNPVVTGAIVGGRHQRQIEELIGASEFRIDELGIEQIDKFLHTHPQALAQ